MRRAIAALPDGWHAVPPGNFLAPSLAMAWLGRSDRPRQEYSIIRRARQRRLGYSQVTTSRWQLFCDGLQRACKKMHRRSAMSCGIFSTARSGILLTKHARSASGILKTRSRPGNFSATACRAAVKYTRSRRRLQRALSIFPPVCLLALHIFPRRRHLVQFFFRPQQRR